MLFDPIQVLTRPKKNGLGTHFGVRFPSGEVIDYTAGDGFRRVTFREFAEGEKVTVVREIPWSHGPFVRARLDDLMRNPRDYDLLTWNCETFAEWLTSGVERSAQVVGGLLLIGSVFALALVARS
jgi:hypothetical protein